MNDQLESHAIVLVGMAGVGKSAVGRVIAQRLGRSFIDTDTLAEERAGSSIAQIFAGDGEAAFRELEREVVAHIVATVRDEGSAPIIATGGFTIGDPDSRRALNSIGTLVRLSAPTEVIAERAGSGAASGAPVRPLLQAPNVASIALLEAERLAVYGSVPWCVETGERDIEATADAVIELCRSIATDGAGHKNTTVVAVPVATPPSGSYPILVGTGLLDGLGPILSSRSIHGAMAIVTDENVGPLYASRVKAGLGRAGLTASVHVIGVGEATKTPETVRDLVEAFAAAGHGRDMSVIALGGGVVTDTAGMAAATYLRGVRLVNVPTTLLAMVDAAIGGKTGVNLRAGKNLFGAFHQPALVAADPTALDTLPERDLRGGLAEVVKAALIDAPELLESLEDGPPTDAAGWTELIRHAASVKARIVSGDPEERTGGRRELLNLGHTFAHAIEHVSNHAVPHGEAVSMGLVLAARLSGDMGLADPSLARTVANGLERLGLPTTLPERAGDGAALVAAMGVDKKRRGGLARFVVPVAPGNVVIREGIPEEAVLAVLERQ